VVWKKKEGTTPLTASCKYEKCYAFASKPTKKNCHLVHQIVIAHMPKKHLEDNYSMVNGD
jgi:hypothetical protein